MSSNPDTRSTRMSADTLTLSSADASLASVPHLVGFACDNSIVLVGLAADAAGGSATVRLTQRFDTPPETSSASDLRAIAHAAAQPMARSGSTQVIIAVFGDTPPIPGQEPPSTLLVDELVNALDDAGVAVKDALFTDGTSRWSYGCDNPACCPPGGRVIPGEVRTLIAAEFAVTGAAMVPSRQALVAEIAPGDPDMIDEVAGHLAAHGDIRDGSTEMRGAGVEEWRDGAIADLARVATGEQLGPESSARALAGLADIRVRDTVLWDLAQPGARTPATVAGYTTLVRRAPDGHVAPAATVLAVVHWTGGDGARANVALDRAAADDPGYTLATMVTAALRSGLPPQAWADSLASLSRRACRHAASPEPRRPTPRTSRAPGFAPTRMPDPPGLAS